MCQQCNTVLDILRRYEITVDAAFNQWIPDPEADAEDELPTWLPDDAPSLVISFDGPDHDREQELAQQLYRAIAGMCWQRKPERQRGGISCG